MWSFATHAGAGMAIAGITATYYALARRNYQGERERMEHESGFGDGPQINRLRKHADSHLTSSHMLLKKELEELSALNGSGSGLNILYQHKNPIRQFHRSNFDITPIVSRVDTRPSTIYSPSEEEIGTSAAGGESVFGSESNLGKGSTKDDIVSDEHPENPVDKEAKPAVSVNVNGGGDVTDEKVEISTKEDSLPDPNENEGESISTVDAKQCEPITEKWKSVQDNQFLKRTPSPVCFFKNPGFGNRYAVNVKRKKEPTTPLVATLSSSKTNVTAKVAEGQPQDPHKSVPLSPSENCQENSTQFILSPILSKSNVSVCEDENPEKLLKRRRKYVPPETKTIVDTHPVETMTEYNKDLRRKMIASNAQKDGKKRGQQPLIRLRADPENSNFRSPKTTTKAKRSLPPTIKEPVRKPELHSDAHTEQMVKKKTCGEANEKVFEDEKIGESNNNEPIEKLIADEEVKGEVRIVPSLQTDSRVGSISTRTSSVVAEIPSNSWVSLPVRIYTNSMRTLPWSLIGICVLVVIIAGLLGIFLSRLANSITRRHREGKM